jgi:hypothetical protein
MTAVMFWTAMLALIACGESKREAAPPRAETPARVESAEPPVETAAGRWTALASENAPSGRDGAAVAFDSDALAIWGGHAVDGIFQTYVNTGAIFDATRRVWTSLPTEGAPPARMRAAAVLTEGTLFVFGGRDGMNPLATGAVFDRSSWRALPAEGAPSAASDVVAIAIPNGIVVWGGSTADGGYSGDGAIFDLDAFRWRPMNGVGGPSARGGATAVWTGDEVIVWGGVGPNGALGDGARYDPATDTWRSVSREGAPSPRLRHAAIWTGDEMIVWGGDRARAEMRGDGAIYRPSDDSWRPMRAGPLEARTSFGAAWTSDRAIYFGGDDGTRPLADGALYDPAADRWTLLPSEGAPAARHDPALAWLAGAAFVYGGTGEGGALLTDGALFVP